MCLKNPENRFAIVQISGPAGAGKGPLCEALTQMGPVLINRNIGTFDRGAAGFRSVTVLARGLGLDPVKKSDQPKIEKAIKAYPIEYGLDQNGKPVVFVAGVNVTKEIRDPWVDCHVAETSHIAATHQFTDELQDRFIQDAKQEGIGVVVLDTRDIDIKRIDKMGYRLLEIELNAELGRRALLRQREFEAQGKNLSLEKVQQDLLDRDCADAGRENGRGTVRLNGKAWHLERKTDSIVPVARLVIRALKRF